MSRVFGGAIVPVTYRDFMLDNEPYSFSPEVTRFIESFDEAKGVEPFEFDVVVN